MLGCELNDEGGAVPRAGLSGDAVTRAAADLADEVGLDAVTLAALARQFGVAVPSLYAHVRSAADVRTRVALLAAAERAKHARLDEVGILVPLGASLLPAALDAGFDLIGDYYCLVI